MRALFLGLVLIGTIGISHAQSQPTSRAFEVTSIKPRTGPRVFGGSSAPNRLNWPDTTVRQLLLYAYQLQRLQLIGGPGWLDTNRYEVIGLASDPMSPSEKQQMVQRLLADRFNLKVHTETRELPIYALVMARADGRLGPDIRRSNLDCPAARAAMAAGNPPAADDPASECNTFHSRTGRGVITQDFRGESLPELARRLTGYTNRMVVDRSGLSGTFNFSLGFAADQIAWLPPLPPEMKAPPGQDGPSLSTALQEQLGLKLESTKGPVNVIVIDSVERPTED